jgi:hypothetical protein
MLAPSMTRMVSNVDNGPGVNVVTIYRIGTFPDVRSVGSPVPQGPPGALRAVRSMGAALCVLALFARAASSSLQAYKQF